MGFRVFRIEPVSPTWDAEHDFYFVRRSRPRASVAFDDAAFKTHLIAAKWRVVLGRCVGLGPVGRLRVALAIRTRLRRLVRGRPR